METINGVKVYRCPIYIPANTGGLKRLFHLVSFGLSTFPVAVLRGAMFRPDIVLGVAPTITSALSARLAAALSGSRSWLHVQDLEVDAAFELGLLRNKVMRSVALAIERSVMRSFHHVSTISNSMVDSIRKKSIELHKLFEFKNWVDTDNIVNTDSSYTAYRDELSIGKDRIVALYSGNMAAKQGIESLAEVARYLKDSEHPVDLLLCGDGPAKMALEKACAGLSNVHFIPLQPYERLSELLGTADVHLLPQRPEAADLVLPSKLTGMLASGRPVVAMALPGTSLAAEVDGAGFAVAPTSKAMAEAVAVLAGDENLRLRLGRGARDRAEKYWHKRSIMERLDERLQGMLAG